MFMVAQDPVTNNQRRKGRPLLKRANVRIDMTPMVDLGFLLICFFVFTTTMSRPVVTVLYMPKEGPPLNIADSKTLTVLLGRNNQVYYYDGSWQTALKNNAVHTTNFSVNAGVGNIIRTKQKLLEMARPGGEGRKGLVLVIKAGKESSYKNFADVLDEVLINDVTHYMVVEPEAEESNFLLKNKN
jgi:biopolymer transport protein ExbD